MTHQESFARGVLNEKNEHYFEGFLCQQGKAGTKNFVLTVHRESVGRS